MHECECFLFTLEFILDSLQKVTKTDIFPCFQETFQVQIFSVPSIPNHSRHTKRHDTYVMCYSRENKHGNV